MTERTPRKKAAAPAAAKAAPAKKVMPGQVTFQGRIIKVKMPEPEQIVIWRMTMRRLQDAQTNSWTGQQVMDALERIMGIIGSVLVEDADKTWLEDQMLAGQLGIKEAASILLDAVSSFSNREQRRATAKAAPARRKKA